MVTLPRPGSRARPRPRRPARRVSLGEAEAFLASHPELRGGKGRPRAGEATVIPALIARFGCSSATAKRVLARLRERRRRAAAATLPVPPDQAALLAAIAARYAGLPKKGSSSRTENSSSTYRPLQPPITQALTPSSSGRSALPALLDAATVRTQLIDILRSWEKEDPLWTLLRPLLPPPAAPAERSRPPVAADGSAVAVARAILIEALDAYDASTAEAEPVQRAMRSLRQYLEQRQAQLAQAAGAAPGAGPVAR